MRDLLARLRAAISPQAALALACALLFIAFSAFSREENSMTALEKRASRVLSSVTGAGRVDVVVYVRAAENTDNGVSRQQSAGVPAGAVAVAQGANDPIVCHELKQALCALLSLPASAVSVITGGN